MRFTCVLLLVLLLCPIACLSQDLILKRNGEQVAARIMDISEGQIKFKEYTNQRGQTHFLRTAEVVLVRFQNGTERIFELEEVLGEEMVQDSIAVHHNTWTLGQYQNKAHADATAKARADVTRMKLRAREVVWAMTSASVPAVLGAYHLKA